MARPPYRGRLSPADHKRAVNAALDYLQVPEHIRNKVAPRRDKVMRSDGKPAHPLEREVLADIMQALRNDERIWFIWRHTTGRFRDGDRWIQVGLKGMPDICGFLKGGRALFIEVKRPGGGAEPHQEQKLEYFRKGGAIAGVATSVAEALDLLTADSYAAPQLPIAGSFPCD